jgi:hypothetical protein
MLRLTKGYRKMPDTFLPGIISSMLGDDPNVLKQVLNFLQAIDLFHVL